MKRKQNDHGRVGKKVSASMKSLKRMFTGGKKDKKLLGLGFRGWYLLVAAITLFASAGTYQLFFTNGKGIVAGAETISDIPYASTSDKQKLDLYLPTRNGEAVPLIINVHGGGFGYFGGSEDDEAYNVGELNAAGFAVASVEYRVYQDALFPAGVQDVKAAVRWLRANAGTYGIDPNKFGATGRSAGGYLVVALGVTGDQATIFDDPTLGNAGVSSAVQAVLDLYGPTNLKTMYSDLSQDGCDSGFNNSDSPEASWLGSSIDSSPNAENANLIKYVQTATKLPRFLIGHGSADCNVSPRQSEALVSALQAKGEGPVLDIRNGAGHADSGLDNSMISPSIAMFNEVFAATTDPGGGTDNGGGSGTDTGTPGEVSQTGNLLTGKVFSSSVGDSTTEPGNPPFNLTDGNGTSKWVSVAESPADLTVDLGGVYTLNKVSIKWVGSTTHNFSIQVSTEGTDWTTVQTSATHSVSSDVDYADYTTFDATPTGKYLRLVLADRWSDVAPNAIWEIGAYGAAAGAGDTAAPVATVATPQDGSSVTGTTPVEGTVSDDTGVTKVELVVDGTVIATNDSPNAAFTWDTSGQTDGAHTIAIKAYDAAGKTGTSPIVNVTVSNSGQAVAPKIQNLNASPATINVGGTATLAWDVMDVASCTLSPDGPQDTTATSWQTPTLTAPGTKTYTLDCQNTAGTHVTRTVDIVVEEVATPPGKPVLTASARTINEGESIGLSWTSTGATECTLNPGNIISTGDAGVSLNKLSEDTTFTVQCQNASGSSTSDPVMVSVTKIPVTVPGPTIVSFAADPAKVSTDGMSTLQWTTSNVPTGSCSLSPSPLNVADANSSWVTPALATSATYTLTCANSQGVTVSKSVTVNVENTPAPAATTTPKTSVPTNVANSTQSTLVASNGQNISNGGATNEVSGLTTIDPTNVTDSSKEQSIARVEYYEGVDLVQTDTVAPFALDTTKLKDGSHTVTERTYFADGSLGETTKVIQVSNGLAANTSGKSSGSILKSPGFWVSIILIPLVGIGAVLLLRRKLMGDSNATAYADYSDVLGNVVSPTTYNDGTPDWQSDLTNEQRDHSGDGNYNRPR